MCMSLPVKWRSLTTYPKIYNIDRNINFIIVGRCTSWGESDDFFAKAGERYIGDTKPYPVD